MDIKGRTVKENGREVCYSPEFKLLGESRHKGSRQDIYGPDDKLKGRIKAGAIFDAQDRYKGSVKQSGKRLNIYDTQGNKKATVQKP